MMQHSAMYGTMIRRSLCNVKCFLVTCGCKSAAFNHVSFSFIGRTDCVYVCVHASICLCAYVFATLCGMLCYKLETNI